MPAQPPPQSVIDEAEYYRELGMSQYEAYDLAIRRQCCQPVEAESFFRLSDTNDRRISSLGDRRIYQ